MVVIRKINIQIVQGRTFSVKNTRVKPKIIIDSLCKYTCLLQHGKRRNTVTQSCDHCVMHIFFK